MAAVTMRELLEAGVHFGHQTRRWDPKMRRFIFGERGGIYIINLEQTLQLLEEAAAFARNLAERGGTILFVGTKKQAQDSIEEQAKRVGMPYVNHRWLGGLLTNWRTISGRIDRLHELRRLNEEGQLDLLPPKERISMVGRARAAREPSRRCRRHEAPAGCAARGRPAQGGDRGARGAASRPPGRRPRRHELRSRRGRPRDSGQRRRDQVLRPRDPDDRGRDGGREAEGEAGRVRRNGCARGRAARRASAGRAGGAADRERRPSQRAAERSAGRAGREPSRSPGREEGAESPAEPEEAPKPEEVPAE